MDTKIKYEAPKLTEVGSFEEITKGAAFQPTSTDATFPTDTPFDQTTWTS